MSSFDVNQSTRSVTNNKQDKRETVKPKQIKLDHKAA